MHGLIHCGSLELSLRAQPFDVSHVTNAHFKESVTAPHSSMVLPRFRSAVQRHKARCSMHRRSASASPLSSCRGTSSIAGVVVMTGIYVENHGQKATGQKATGQKTTENVNPGQKTTQTKNHPDKRPPCWFFSGEILSHLNYSFIRQRVKKGQK